MLTRNYTDIEDFLTHWTSTYMEQIDFFHGNSSYMDLGDFLRNQTNEESSPCIILDTDIHLHPSADDETFSQVHTFYICELTDDPLIGRSIHHTKNHLKLLFFKLYRFLLECRAVDKDKRHFINKIDMRYPVDSTSPFMNGWEAIKITVTERLFVPCFDPHDYNFDQS